MKRKSNSDSKPHSVRKSSKSPLPTVAAGAAAICAGALSIDDARAAPVHRVGPLALDINGPDIEWDVDGDGNADFLLQTTASITTSSRTRYTTRYFMINSHDGRGGRGFVNSTPGRPAQGLPRPRPAIPPGQSPDVQNLAPGLLVGPTLPGGHFWGFTDIDYRTMISTSNSPGGRSATMGSAAVGFLDGMDGFAGFRFAAADGMHYGWARMNIDLQSVRLTVRDWAFESIPGAAIQVGAVPEPSTAALALFAAGAAGVGLWRRRIRHKQQLAP
jgi:hypothetical protein